MENNYDLGDRVLVDCKIISKNVEGTYDIRATSSEYATRMSNVELKDLSEKLDSNDDAKQNYFEEKERQQACNDREPLDYKADLS